MLEDEVLNEFSRGAAEVLPSDSLGELMSMIRRGELDEGALMDLIGRMGE